MENGLSDETIKRGYSAFTEINRGFAERFIVIYVAAIIEIDSKRVRELNQSF